MPLRLARRRHESSPVRRLVPAKRVNARLTVVEAAMPRGSTSTRRVAPSRWQYDYLVLSRLSRDVSAALGRAGAVQTAGRVALDVGAGGGPYRALLDRCGYVVRTLDIAAGE